MSFRELRLAKMMIAVQQKMNVLIEYATKRRMKHIIGRRKIIRIFTKKMEDERSKFYYFCIIRKICVIYV